jgi:hypothetical protein
MLKSLSALNPSSATKNSTSSPAHNNRRANVRHTAQARFVILFVLFAGFVLRSIPGLPVFASEISIALLTSGVISLVYEIMLRESFLSEMKDQRADSLSSEFEVLKRIDSAGIIDVYRSFPSSDMAERFLAASKVRIMQTWIPDLVTFLGSLRESCTKGCVVELLLLDPDSSLAEVRGQDLGYPDPQMVSENTKSNLMEIRRFCLQEGIGHQFQIRLYNTIPSISLYSYDDIIFIGFYLNKTPAIQNPQIEIRENSSYFADVINKHYSRIWESAKPFNINI